MGTYTGLKIKAIIHPDFREVMYDTFYNGWESNEMFHHLAKLRASHFIPFGRGGIPYQWQTDEDRWANDEPDFSCDQDTGYVVFRCGLKNYDNEIETFIETIPLWAEAVALCEVLCEDWPYSRLYSLLEGKMVLVRTELGETVMKSSGNSHPDDYSITPDSAQLKPCRLCGGHVSVDFYKPQGYMAYCPRCHFVMSTRETTIEKAVEVWNNNN